jgi:uncharacterized metal-binding protein
MLQEEDLPMVEHTGPVCAICGARACSAEPGTKDLPAFCPMAEETDLLAQVEKIYLNQEPIRRLAIQSARTESSGYCQSTRIEEIMDFARRIGARTLGIAHCVGLMREARLAREIFRAGGFEVFTVCCKVGSISKEKIGLRDEEKIRPGQFEALCSPVGQAALLDQAGAQLNVLIGLCVGHDSLFFMHSKAPVTVLVAKDRVLGHNPAACLYTSHSYYQRLTSQSQ